MTPVRRTTILICDDSRSYAAGLRKLLEHDPSLEVLAVSPSGEHALEAVKRLRPALVIMDLELPGMGGVKAIEEIMRTDPIPVLVLSAYAQHGSAQAAAALAAGALDALPKTQLRLSEPNGPDAVALRDRIKLLARVHVPRALPVGLVPPPTKHSVDLGEPTVLGIGASTGGPTALLTVLRGIPAGFRLPILIVQHIGPDFLAPFARQLDRESPCRSGWRLRGRSPQAPGSHLPAHI